MHDGYCFCLLIILRSIIRFRDYSRERIALYRNNFLKLSEKKLKGNKVVQEKCQDIELNHYHVRACILVVSDLLSQTKVSWFELDR